MPTEERTRIHRLPKEHPNETFKKMLHVRAAFNIGEGRGDIEGVLDRILILIAESCGGKWECRQTGHHPGNTVIEWTAFEFPNGDGQGYDRVKNFDERIDKVTRVLRERIAFGIFDPPGKSIVAGVNDESKH